jgi:glycosyltransferase involved in cell wall biosynthesis
MQVLDIGFFAHNEAKRIGPFLESLSRQSIFRQGVDVRLHILANGCTDDTVAVATRLVAKFDWGSVTRVHDLPEGGKSRTWNRFTHELARPDAEMLVYCDADIAFLADDTIEKLCAFLTAHPTLSASSSYPVKDLALGDQPLTLVQKLIVSGASSREEARTAICGQLYVARSADVRRIWMPVGLPVEDGYLRAMLLTRNFTEDENTALISADPEIAHVYESERDLSGLLRHQIRIVIGGAINLVLFDYLRSVPLESRTTAVAEIADNERWLGDLLAKSLPRSYGWVPVHFLIKRTQSAILQGGWYKPGRFAKLLLGQAFDLIVWIAAQWKMARGSGAGFW